ncbi:MAG TPA: GGDEF domain-containing protein, partial [Candidatus Anaerobutyricum stercoripullorum]|nr:GGDEF domain-containing protein [Candidatus Anaerobutyricum stercoripullorum]
TQLPYGAEALIRWNHPRKGLIAPAQFIPVLEKNGFIEKLDYYVWERVCQYIRKWMDEGATPAPISVNMSRVDCSNTNLPDKITHLVQRYNIPPGLLQLELTESAYMDNPDFVNNMIRELRKRGFRIMMDDFGSGFSSLNTLKEIQVDYLKLDMKFLFSHANDFKSKRILSSVVSMAKWLRLKVIAEGVETQEQFDFLRRIQCDYVQGYYFFRPMPAKEYEEKIIPLIEKNPDIEDWSEAQENAIYMSQDIFEKIYADELTGLYNRRFLNEWMFLDRMRPGEELRSVAMIMMDIRSFKAINDNYGHLAGDEVLVNVATVLKTSVRDSDSVIRYGGDEFLIIFLNCPEKRVYSRIDEICVLLADIVYGEKGARCITADYGVSYTENFEKTRAFLNDMISQADERMYQNKKKNSRKM